MLWGDPGFIANFIRWFFSILDSIGYFFLSGIFNVFFTVANATFFQGDVINEFYERVQLILGIFMIFILSFTLLQIIINPDMFKDKQKGAGSLVMRVAVMLVLLTLIVPIKVPEDGNPLNEKINNNGILYGFLYQIQDTVVKDNVLGKLILGYNVADVGDSVTYEDIDGNLRLQGMENVGDVITAEIAKAFITPALKDGYTEVNADPESDNYYEKSALCPTDIAPYLNRLVSSSGLLDHVNLTCKPEGGKEIYAFSYTGFGGVVCAIVMTIIIIGFTLDIAVRAIKLAILRLIAPIPIISYISPGQEKNGAFGNWVKTLTSTYLSLFIRLIIIYFGIYLIILLRNGDLVAGIKESTLANVFVIIGILVFMKEAPKFFQDMLGIKGDGKLFSSVAPIFAAAGIGAGKLAAGTLSAVTGNGFMAGASQVHGNGIVNKGMTMFRNLTPKQQEIIKNKRTGRLELNKLHGQWKKGDRVYGALGKDAFNGEPDDMSYNIFSSREFAESKRAVDNANEHLKDVSARYNEAYSRGKLTQELVEEYEKAQKSLKGKESTHESMRKLYSKDAELEDAYKFRKYNETDPTNINRYIASRNSSSSMTTGNSSSFNTNSSSLSGNQMPANTSSSSTIGGVPVSKPNSDGERTTPSGIILGSGVDLDKNNNNNRHK